MKLHFPTKTLASTAFFVRMSLGMALTAPLLLPTAAMAQTTNAIQAAAVANRLEQQVGGLDNTQRDGARQIAETYVRDRGQNLSAAVAQFEASLKAGLSPIQFQKYLEGRDYVLSGTGARPNNQAQDGTAQKPGNNQPLTPGTLTTRVERAVGGLDNTQRDVVRQLSETFLRDRGQNDSAATAQFEAGLQRSLSPAQFQQYQARRGAILNRGQRR